MRARFPFVLSKLQRGALLILLTSLICITGVRLITFSEPNFKIDWSETNKYQRKLDSLHKREVTSSAASFTYNPNYLTDYTAYRLGIPMEAYDRIKHYRTSGKYMNSIVEFKKISGLSERNIQSLIPLLRFPNKRSVPKKSSSFEKQDLNTVDAKALESVKGIGPTLSKRIINYRKYLSGFSVWAQCYEVYGLDSTVVEKLHKQFEIQTPPHIIRLNINTASLDELTKIPYLTREEARKIVAYRTRNKEISISVLSELFVNSQNKIARIKLYLH
jgi:competence protein ComEA